MNTGFIVQNNEANRLRTTFQVQGSMRTFRSLVLVQITISGYCALIPMKNLPTINSLKINEKNTDPIERNLPLVRVIYRIRFSIKSRL